MADNVVANAGSGGARFVTAQGTWSGDTADVPGCFEAIVSGSEGSWTFAQVVGGAGAVAAGVQRMTLASDDPAVSALGATSDAAATQGSTGSISAKLRTVTGQLNTIANTGIPITGSVPVSSVAGTVAVTQSGTWDEVGINDSGNSITVDAPVATPVYVRLSDGASPISTLPVSDAGGSITVDGSVSVSGNVPGTSATSLGKAEDAVAADGDTGVAVWAVRKDTAATTVGADGDYHPFEVDGNGRLWVNGSSVTQPVSAASLPLPSGASTESTLSTLNGKVTACNTGAVVLTTGTASIGKLAANSGVTIGAVEIASAQTLATVTTVSTVSTVSTLTGGGVAHGASDSGNPVKVGMKATTSLSGLSLVSDAQRTDMFAGVDGVQIVRLNSNLEGIVSGVAAITDGSSTSVIASQGAGVKTYITEVIMANSSATAVTVDLRDGAAGTVKATFSVPAGSGCHKTLTTPIPFSAATAVCADPSAAASTVTVTLVGFKSKI